MPKNYHDLIQKWAGTITDLNRHIKHGEGAKGPPNEGPFLNLHTDEKKVAMVVKGLKKKLETAKKKLKEAEDGLEKQMKGHGGRRTRRRRGGNPKFRTQKSPYLTYDKHLSEADAAKEAAQAEEDRQHANETRKKYMALAEKPRSRIADGHSIYTQYRLRVAHTRRNAKGVPAENELHSPQPTQSKNADS
jgi:hypothetical protein